MFDYDAADGAVVATRGPMGIFNTIADAAREANEGAHGARLQGEFDDTLRILSTNRPIADAAIAMFVQKRRQLLVEMWNWTRDGKLKVAAELKRQARATLDFNMIEGNALWFASAWLESSVRTAPASRNVFMQLDGLGAAHDAIDAAGLDDAEKAEAITTNAATAERAERDLRFEGARKALQHEVADGERARQAGKAAADRAREEMLQIEQDRRQARQHAVALPLPSHVLDQQIFAALAASSNAG